MKRKGSLTMLFLDRDDLISLRNSRTLYSLCTSVNENSEIVSTTWPRPSSWLSGRTRILCALPVKLDEAGAG